ncbi:hypothetical protein YA62_017670 [Agrobacterium sp. LC34]|uniref:Uncharacterized protein n=1 Tax=Agrobacterium tumefaciens TaxID=358 RepID=A0AAE6BPS7_AGRTU|nr:hypothetical protein CFBP6623_07415 [Agrobacterium tumefaciens]QCM01409.1 hypothetical protein CFBP6624_06930 [Agrobacterium tumefaciens]TKT58588.1 hypothetical protein YA62_017670 [Agrobacterium sp. LC34]
MCGAGFRSGKPKPRISGVRHKGDTAVFPCFSAVVKKAVSHKKAAPAGRLFRGALSGGWQSAA